MIPISLLASIVPRHVAHHEGVRSADQIEQRSNREKRANGDRTVVDPFHFPVPCTHPGALFSPYSGIVHDCAAIMHHTAPWYLPWGLKLVPLPIPPGHPASGIPNPGLHLLAPLPGIYAPEPRKVRTDFSSYPPSPLICLCASLPRHFCYIDRANFRR